MHAGTNRERWGRLRIGAMLLLVVAIVAIAYVPLARNGFVGWDDLDNIAENPALRRPITEQIRWAWQTTLLGVYQPLSWMLYTAQAAIFDIRADAVHLTTLALHLFCTIAFFAVARRLLRLGFERHQRVGVGALTLGATAATLFFAAHPLRVESVAWASGQPYVLCCLFFLLCVYAYLKSQVDGASRRERWTWYAASIAFCAAAVLSKGIAVSIVVVLLVLDVYPLRRLRLSWNGFRSMSAVRVIAEKIPFAILVAVAIWKGTEATQSNAALSYLGGVDRLAIAAYGLTFYLHKTFIPLGLSAYYPLPLNFVATDWPFVVSGATVLALTTFLIAMHRRWPGGLAAWTCYVAALAPVLGVVQHGSQIAADRYSHFACMGIAVLIGAGVAACAQARRSAVLTVGTVGAVALASLTWRQVTVWRDSLSLWMHATAVNSRNDFAVNNAGVALYQIGRVDEAVERYERAAEMNRTFEEPPYNLGVIMAARDDTAAAIRWYEEALRRKPAMAKARNNLGNIYMRLRNIEQAIECYKTAINLEPQSPGRDEHGRDPIIANTYASLGTAYGATGRASEAIAAFEESLVRDPENPDALFGMALAYVESADPQAAVPYLKRLIIVQPERADARELLMTALRAAGRHREVADLLRATLVDAPDDVVALNNLAWLLATSPDDAVRNGAEALRLARRACELAGPSALVPRATLAAAFAETGAYDDAIATASVVRAQADAAGAADLVAIIDRQIGEYRAHRAIRER